MLKLILLTTFLLAAATLAQTPIPRQGDSCPTGTYRSGDYCKLCARFVEKEKQVIVWNGPLLIVF